MEHLAEAYYKAFGEKDMATLEKYVHPDIQFISPFSKLKGKEPFLESAKGFTDLFKTLKIRAKFGSGDRAMIVYDLDCPEPIGLFSSSALMTFKEGLLIKLELFFDARPFVGS